MRSFVLLSAVKVTLQMLLTYSACGLMWIVCSSLASHTRENYGGNVTVTTNHIDGRDRGKPRTKGPASGGGRSGRPGGSRLDTSSSGGRRERSDKDRSRLVLECCATFEYCIGVFHYLTCRLLTFLFSRLSPCPCRSLLIKLFSLCCI